MFFVASARTEPPAPKRYLVDAWRSEQGLPQHTATGIAQTSDGYLWVSTLDGLARFDGMHFTAYKAGNTPEIGSGRLRFLFTGRSGALWLATQEGGVIEFRNGRFRSLPLPESSATPPAVIHVVETENGTLWLSREDGKVERIANGVYSVVSTNWDAKGKTAFQVRADERNQVWALSKTALFKVRGDALIPMLKGGDEFVVCCPSQGGGWWISMDGELRLWRDGQWLAKAACPISLTQSIFRVGMEDQEGHVWLATWGNGLLRCDTNGSGLHFTKRDGLGSDYVRALHQDRDGNLWVGTQEGGLNRLRPALFTVFGLAQDLSLEWITSVSAGPDGRVWVGTDGYGLNSLQGDLIQPAVNGFESGPLHVMVALAGRNGVVWTGNRSGGIHRWDGRRAERPANVPSNGLITSSLFEDSRGAVWVGWRNTDRVLKIENGIATYIELPESFGRVDVRVIAEDPAGGHWFGTDGAGLLHLKDGRFTRYTHDNGLASDFVWSLYAEPDGTLWVGTFGGGLSRLQAGNATSCTTRNGLADDVICHIAEDGHQQFWMSSHQGVFRVSKNELKLFFDRKTSRVHCNVFGKSDGLPTLECKGGFQPAGSRGPDGRLWFPTIAGVTVVNPEDVPADSIAPPVYVEEVLVDGEPLFRNNYSSGPPATPLQAAPGKKRFEFRYTALNFNAPDKSRFRHRLEGVDADWVETGGGREASYHQLARGVYTFRVQTCNREGRWGEDGASFPFIVLPFFWQTWWFMGLFLLVFGSAVAWTAVTVVRRRHRRHLELVRRLHAADRERTRIARDIHDDIGSSLTEIGLLGAIAMRETTPRVEARKQVERIMSRAEEMARKLDETVWAVNPKNDSLRHLASYLCNLAKEFLEPTGIRCRLDVSASLPDALLTTEVRHNVFLAAKEAMNNTVQHAKAAELWLRMTAENGLFTIEIEDDGCGFLASEANKGGNGLRNMAERMHEIGGQFEVSPREGGGTVVRLRLPFSIDAAPGAESKPLPI